MRKRSETYGSSSPSSSPRSSPSSTTTSQPLPTADYEVFLSFRGPDVRTNFADFLYESLGRSNIRTFLDDEALAKGGHVAESLIKAIEDSKVYIPILSPDYASSKWCLQELAHMVKCFKQGEGHIILPIFYMVEPRDVRHQTGTYNEAFQHHIAKKRDADTIEEWKEALASVGEMKGWHVTKSTLQGKLINEVHACARSHLMRSYRLVTEKLVGIEHQVEQVTNRLNQGVKVVGIFGMSGMGKTTIAMAVRDEIYMQFDYCCFLKDVRETLSEKGGIVALQKQIISIIPGHDGNVQDASQGLQVIKDRVRKHNVLVIIDDADERFKFEQILGKPEDFSSKSRFIITTTNKRVVDIFQDGLYKPGELGADHSLQLFSMHAFGLDHPPEGYEDISRQFIEVVTTLPLALKVVGASLLRREEFFWKVKLKQLKEIPHHKVEERLKTSYLDLTFEEKQIFLDIASVFIGVQKELPFYMWSECDFYPELGIDTLILKSLIKVDNEDKLWMHDAIRDLGRTIVHKENHQYAWKRSRIWSNKDALRMLVDEKGTERLEVLKVNMIGTNIILSDRQFEKLTGLRYLQVSHGDFKGNIERVLPNLCWLALNTCCLMSTDANVKKSIVFFPRSSGGFDLRDSWSNWEKVKAAHQLKAIDLWNCNGLGKGPDLSQPEDLRLLSLDYHLSILKELLQLGCEGVNVIAICGIGGIGKTTIAKALYNEVRGQFDCSCFLDNVGEILSKVDSTVSLQRKLVSMALQGDCEIKDASEGISIIKSRICNQKVLIILDDVNDWFDYVKTFGKTEDFCSGSRFIITSRNHRVGLFCHQLYTLAAMNYVDSLQLFSMHAFGVNHPPSFDYDLLSDDFLSVSKGHPLVLTVLGSLLFGRDKSYWEGTREQLKKITDPFLSMNEVLMISYNALSYEEQQILLDIACFFTGQDKAKPFHMWNSCGFHPESAIATLARRCLIKINRTDKGEEFWMHDLVRDLLSRATIRQEDIECPWKRSRIWFNEDALNMLTHEKGTDRVKALRVEIKDKNFKLTNKQFEKLSGLIYLEVDGGEFEGNSGNILPNIHWLQLRDCGSNLIDCDMKKLVILHIEGSTVGDDWGGWEKMKVAYNLKSFVLHGCSNLEEVPDLSQCRSLESIDISWCMKMRGALHISHLENLKSIRLRRCSNLERVPDLSQGRNLESIDISGCMKMSGELHVGHLENLKVLKIVDTNIGEITGHTGMLQKLQEITLPRRLVSIT
ncbi:Disease resistance protein L6 [Linum perenne]